MKACVKATGEIVEVEWRYLTNLNGFNSIRYVDQKTGISYFKGDLTFDIEGKFVENCLNGIKQGVDYNPDYWTRLEHQYAGMAMHAILLFYGNAKVNDDYCAEEAKYYARALVEELKKEEK